MTQQLMKKVFMLTVGVALLFGAVPAPAQTYDFVADYSIAGNPNGAWSYGWETFRGGPFTLMDRGWTDYSYGTQDVWSSSVAPSSPSIALAVTDINHPTLFVPAGTVNTHPGYNGENPVVRWTAPASGTYLLEGWFIGNDHGWTWQQGVTTTTDVAVLRGPLEVFSGYVESYNVPLPFSVTLPLLTGETVDFNVGFGRNGSWWHDSTGLAATITKVSDLACTLPPAGMVAWWTADGTANDSIGGNNGTMLGGTAFAPGMVGQAFRFTADSDSIALGNPPALQLSGRDFTVDAWVNYAPEDMNTDGAIVSKMDDYMAANGDGWMLLRQTDDHFWFCFGAAPDNGCTPTADTTVISTTTAAAGTWYHVAGVRSATEFAIYVNGVKEASKPLPAFIDSDRNPAFIGDYRLRHQLLGLIDEVEIYDRALTADEVRGIYLAGSAGTCKVVSVVIDINPGSVPNSINPNSNGVIPVAILTSAAFDAATVDAATVRFGATGQEAAPRHFALEDVNGDGKTDLIIQFPTQNTGIACGTTSATLTGKTIDGFDLSGTDSVNTVGCK